MTLTGRLGTYSSRIESSTVDETFCLESLSSGELGLEVKARSPEDVRVSLQWLPSTRSPSV